MMSQRYRSKIDGDLPSEGELEGLRGESKDEEADLSQFPEGELLQITSVERMKRPNNRYMIHFGPYSVAVHEDVMIKYRMLKDGTFTKEDLETIVAADELQRCYAESIRYLSRRMRTQHEISSHLQEKGWEDDTIQEVTKRLQREKLIDDALYALEWTRQRVKNRGKGKMWVRQELRQKGVPKPLVEEALSSLGEEDEFISALELGAKKWRQIKGETLEKRRKTGAFLMRRGFSGSIASRVLSSLSDKDSQEVHEDIEEW